MMRHRDPQHDGYRATWRHVVALLLLAVPATNQLRGAEEVKAEQQAWEFSPYKVQIWLATETAGELNERVRESLSFALSQRIEAIIGAPWAAEIIEPPADLRSSMLIDPALVTPAVLDTVAAESLKNDKIILLTVHVNPREFQVEARELDCRMRVFGPSTRRVVRQPDLLGVVCFDAVSESFRAVTRLEIGEPRSAVVRTRAGGLVLDEASPCYVGVDDILLPIQRNNDRAGRATSVTPIEWTFLQVQTQNETNPQLMTCRVWSGRPNPVTGKATSRRERVALKVKPIAETTTLRVMSRVVVRGEEPYPMPGLEVYGKAPPPDPPAETATATPAESSAPSEAAPGDGIPTATQAPVAATEAKQEPATAAPAAAAETAAAIPTTPKVKEDPSVLLGRTDWNGMLEIGRAETPLRLVYLKNGGQLLARLPIVPGLEPMLIASVPDDGPRLEAEGFIKGLQGQLMDLEAQREILKARFLMRIEEGKLDEAQTLLDEIKQLPTRNFLKGQLDTQQNQQLVSPVESVQTRIDQLYAKMTETLAKYLSPAMVNELTTILNTARRNPPATATAAPAT